MKACLTVNKDSAPTISKAVIKPESVNCIGFVISRFGSNCRNARRRSAISADMRSYAARIRRTESSAIAADGGGWRDRQLGVAVRRKHATIVILKVRRSCLTPGCGLTARA